MVKTYLYTSSHQEEISTKFRTRVVEAGIEFEEIDVAFEKRHFSLSCIPCLIIEKDGVEIGRFEERETPIDMNEVMTFLGMADQMVVTPPNVVDTSPLQKAREDFANASTLEQRVDVLAKFLGLK